MNLELIKIDNLFNNKKCCKKENENENKQTKKRINTKKEKVKQQEVIAPDLQTWTLTISDENKSN